MKGRARFHSWNSSFMVNVHKVFGPIGQTRYRVGYLVNDNPSISQEIYDSAMHMGFRSLMTYDNGNNLEFLIEAKNEEMEALFRLTWSDMIDSSSYDHDKARSFPPDWLSVLLYYTIRQLERNFTVTFVLTIILAMTPVFLTTFLNNNDWIWLTFLVIGSMTILGILRSYDDHRKTNYERKMRISGLHEEF